jgi:hypothetical protein
MAEIVLTVEQTAIVGHDPKKHARVLAGPGTGKSATLVALMSELLAGKKRPRVRLLTFTRAATAELAKKLSENPSTLVERPSTIHSFAISVLLRNPGAGSLPQPLRLADDWEFANVIRPTLAARAGVGLLRLDALVRELAAPQSSPHSGPRLQSAFRTSTAARALLRWPKPGRGGTIRSGRYQIARASSAKASTRRTAGPHTRVPTDAAEPCRTARWLHGRSSGPYRRAQSPLHRLHVRSGPDLQLRSGLCVRRPARGKRLHQWRSPGRVKLRRSTGRR